MVWQRIRHSGAVHRERHAPSVSGAAKCWATIGVLIAGGATAYLPFDLPVYTRVLEGLLPNKAHAQPGPHGDHADGPLSSTWQSSTAGRGLNSPPLKLEDSSDAAVRGEVRTLALQAAVEREKSRAEAAQLRVTDLQEQLTRLTEEHGEKQEEIIVLREELAELKANPLHSTEQQRRDIEEKQRANFALSRLGAAYEELNGLKTSVIEAKKVADREREKAAAALEELENVKGQLAVLAALERERKEAEIQLRSGEDQLVAFPLPESQKEVLPANEAPRLFQPPGPDTASSNRQGADPERNSRQEKSQIAIQGKARPVSVRREAKVPGKGDNNPAPSATPNNKSRSETDAARLTGIRPATRGQSLRSVEKISPKASESSHSAVQEVRNSRNPSALNLPSALRPDNRLW